MAMSSMREMKSPFFILAGNGHYDNRGCEAIVRGTVVILRHYFDKPKFLVASNYQTNSQFEQQRINEKDEAVVHVKTILAQKRFEPIWFLSNSLRFLYPMGMNYLIYKDMLPYLKKTLAVLSVGGDNYSLDYGIPKIFTGLDDLVFSRKKPMVIWGASVGPFSKIPEYEKYIIEHLKRINGIFARETATVEYLADKGVTENVFQVADPAFLMEAKEPKKEKFNIEIPKEAIGINLSPLMARYTTDGDLKKWVELAANIVERISRTTKRPIFLIPHVNSPHTNDYAFLRDVLDTLKKTKEQIELIPFSLTATELKWIIAKMNVFVGARTHSTIAALSSIVPTISFAYSIKTKGINQDIFGHSRFCLDPNQLTPEIITEKIGQLIQDAEKIKNQLNLSLPKVKTLAMDAGKYLREVLGE